ncbi:hypothetical protein ACFQ0T_15950 [Kitasatospora gansuensis]
MSLDVALLDVPDSPDNREAYGGGAAAYRALPQVQVLALAESATHAVCAAALGSGDADLVREVLPALRPGQLVVASRGALSYDLWTRARGRGADLLWQAKPSLDLPLLRALDDGSYLSRLAGRRPPTGSSRCAWSTACCPPSTAPADVRASGPGAWSARSWSRPGPPRPIWPGSTASAGASTP